MDSEGEQAPERGHGDEEGARRLRVLAAVSASLASRHPGDLHRTLLEASEALPGWEVEEVILQSYLFLGYPMALNAFGVWRDVSGQRPQAGTADDWQTWLSRGEAVCKAVYEGQYDGLRENVRALHPDMERWMVVEGYGKVLGRPGLGLVLRELCIVALLAVLRTPRQLYSHLRGALNTGATREQVETALAQAFPRLGEAGRLEVRQVWARVLARSQVGEPRPSGERRSGG